MTEHDSFTDLKSCLDFWKRLGVNSFDLQVYDFIVESYSEKNRKYHTLTHVSSCLKKFQDIKANLLFPDSVEMAIWFHDVVYDAGKSDNEEQSAKVTSAICSAHGLPDYFTDRVNYLILATKHDGNNLMPNDYDAFYLLDLDLFGLAWSWEEFVINNKNIQLEFSHFPKAMVLNNQREFLLELIHQDKIYKTEYFYENYENKARENIDRFINEVLPYRSE